VNCRSDRREPWWWTQSRETGLGGRIPYEQGKEQGKLPKCSKLVEKTAEQTEAQVQIPRAIEQGIILTLQGIMSIE
jgi:hypothetical protein